MNDAEHVIALQKALAFWLPRVPAEDSERGTRIADDSYLLMGYPGDDEISAEDRGWIALI